MNFKNNLLRKRCRLIGNEKGVVLVVGMLLLTVLTMIGIAGNNNALIDTTIVFNNLSAATSFYMAEAGLERGKLECVQRYLDGGWTSFDTILKGADNTLGTADDGILTFGNSVSFHNGTYVVKVGNDPNDGSNDTNGVVRITSTGTYGGATTKLQMYLSMTLYANVPSAVTMVGETDMMFPVTTEFSIDGRDYRLTDPDGSPTGTSTKPGIGVGDISTWAHFGNLNQATALNDSIDNINTTLGPLKASVNGTDYSASPLTASIAPQSVVTKESLRALADSCKAVADNLVSYPPNFSGQTDASGNIPNWPVSGQTTNLGTTSNPKITYIDATDNSINNSGVSFTGTGAGITGAGILILEGNYLKLYGKIDWTGLVIVVGDFGSFSTGGNDLIKIRGGLLVGEYLADFNPTVYYEVHLNGPTKIQYSEEAVSLVNTMLKTKPPYSVSGWQRSY